MLDGIQPHIDAVGRGETVEQRLSLIHGSNVLTVEAKRRQAYFLKAFCLASALEPLCGKKIELRENLYLKLFNPRHLLTGSQLPGVRADGGGWLVIEGIFWRDGRRCASFDDKHNPLWPLMLRNPPCSGSGPWENFRPQALSLLKHEGERWPPAT